MKVDTVTLKVYQKKTIVTKLSLKQKEKQNKSQSVSLNRIASQWLNNPTVENQS